MKIGTSHFVSRDTAINYYRGYGFDAKAVDQKIADGEIHIGKPKLNPNEYLTVIDNGARYAIVMSSALSPGKLARSKAVANRCDVDVSTKVDMQAWLDFGAKKSD
jgi:hypothetical protein